LTGTLDNLEQKRKAAKTALVDLEQKAEGLKVSIESATKSIQTKRDQLQTKLQQWQAGSQSLKEKEAVAKQTASELQLFRVNLELKLSNARTSASTIKAQQSELASKVPKSQLTLLSLLASLHDSIEEASHKLPMQELEKLVQEFQEVVKNKPNQR